MNKVILTVMLFSLSLVSLAQGMEPDKKSWLIQKWEQLKTFVDSQENHAHITNDNKVIKPEVDNVQKNKLVPQPQERSVWDKWLRGDDQDSKVPVEYSKVW